MSPNSFSQRRNAIVTECSLWLNVGNRHPSDKGLNFSSKIHLFHITFEGFKIAPLITRIFIRLALRKQYTTGAFHFVTQTIARCFVVLWINPYARNSG